MEDLSLYILDIAQNSISIGHRYRNVVIEDEERQLV